MDALPIFLSLDGRACWVIGADEQALNHIALLKSANAKVTLLAANLPPELHSLVNNGDVEHIDLSADPNAWQNLARPVLMIVTGAAAQQALLDYAAQQNILVYHTTTATVSNCYIPEIIDRSPLLIAIGSRTALFAQLLKQQLIELLPTGLACFANIAGAFRARIKQTLPSITARRYFWEAILNSPIAEQLMHCEQRDGLDILQHELDKQYPVLSAPSGEVYFVGAGPNDPDALTLKALRLMQQADLIIYDADVSAAILELSRRDAEKLRASEQATQHLIASANSGLRVCRLKSGDALMFNNTDQEILAVIDAGIPIHIVPGITSAAAGCAYTGIPLTHRQYAHSCVFVDAVTLAADTGWTKLTDPQQTAVFYNAIPNIETIRQQLQAHGLKNTTPVAIVSPGGTTPAPPLIGTLHNISALAATASTNDIVIIGEVVKLADAPNTAYI